LHDFRFMVREFAWQWKALPGFWGEIWAAKERNTARNHKTKNRVRLAGRLH